MVFIFRIIYINRRFDICLFSHVVLEEVNHTIYIYTYTHFTFVVLKRCSRSCIRMFTIKVEHPMSRILTICSLGRVEDANNPLPSC